MAAPLSVTPTNYDSIGAFNAISASGLLGQMQNLEQWLDQFAEAALAQTVPLTAATSFAEITDLPAAFQSQIVDPLQIVPAEEALR